MTAEERKLLVEVANGMRLLLQAAALDFNGDSRGVAYAAAKNIALALNAVEYPLVNQPSN